MNGPVRQITVTTDPGTPYFLRVVWPIELGAGITLILSDGSTAWIGKVLDDDVTREASNTGLSKGSYVKDLRQALIGSEQESEGGWRAGDTEMYSFQLSPDNCHLSYHKICDNNLVHLGSVELQKAPDSLQLIQEMIGESLKHSTNLEKKKHLLVEENQQLKEEHQNILRELGRVVQDKEMMERDLYSRFANVLHEKKAMIRSLMDGRQQPNQTGDELEDEQKEESVKDIIQAEDGEQEKREETVQSLEPTVFITGRNLTCHGISFDHTDEEYEPPRRKH